MDQHLTNLIYDAEESRMRRFSREHEVFVMQFPRLPLLDLGLAASRDLNRAFADVVDHLTSRFDVVSSVNYFKARLPPPGPDTAPSYWYLALRLTEKGNEQREVLRQEVHGLLEGLFVGFSQECLVASQSNHPQFVDYHVLRQQLYGEVPLEPDELDKTDSAAAKIVEKRAPFVPADMPLMSGSMAVSAFFENLDEGAQLIADALVIGDFILERGRLFKYWRTEWLAIGAYLQRTGWSENDVIEFGVNGERWDAKLSRPYRTEILIEVTQAVPEGAHIVREAFVQRGTLAHDLATRTLHQRGIDSFPDPVVAAIEAKHAKKYAEPRVLLVTVLGEYTTEDDAVIAAWLKDVRGRTHLGTFAAIFLVEIARSRLFRIC
jgi:hypothetical protein